MEDFCGDDCQFRAKHLLRNVCMKSRTKYTSEKQLRCGLLKNKQTTFEMKAKTWPF